MPYKTERIEMIKHNKKNVIIISSLAVAIATILLMVLVNMSITSKAETEQQIEEAKTNIIKNTKVGDVMLYGVYDEEPLEWQVLDVENDKALLITKDCIAQKPFNNEGDDVTWKNSILREWLNNDFIKSFSKVQQSSIKKTKIKDDNRCESEDRIFLLNVVEADKYFPTEELRIAKTKYKVRTDWWLLPPGYDNSGDQAVNSRGYLDGGGDGSFSAGVRPALWLVLADR